jgi:hypothetical protein
VNDRNNKSSAVVPALIGMVVGAALVALSDKRMRQKIIDTTHNLKGEGEKIADKVKDKVQEGKVKSKEEIQKLEGRLEQ